MSPEEWNKARLKCLESRTGLTASFQCSLGQIVVLYILNAFNAISNVSIFSQLTYFGPCLQDADSIFSK